MDAKDRPKKPSFASIVHRILAARSPEHLPLKDEAQKQTSEITSEELSGYETTRRYDKSKTRAHRKGPAPIEDFNKNLTSRKPTIVAGTLDSDAEDIDFRKDRSQEDNDTIKKKKSRNRKITPSDENLTIMASSKGLVLYFAKIGKSNADRIDLKFVEALIEIGADINSSDKHGQAAFHEVAREWHQDVASFLIDKGADINRADKYGRTPLHVASSVNYAKMITLLITNGADIDAETYGEKQTPLHYAAKNNAVDALKTLLRHGANINGRDYKNRTPIFIATETACSEAARFFLDFGAPVGVYDDSGTSCLSLMIAKMPNIAFEALEQFHQIDIAFRKHYFYLSYLEPDPKYLNPEKPKSKKEKMYQKEKEKASGDQENKAEEKMKSFARVPLEMVVQYNQTDLVTHPVFQCLLSVKWNLFGKSSASLMVAANLFYTLLLTVLGFTLPYGNKYYTPLKSTWWRLTLDIIGVLMTMFFISVEIRTLRRSELVYNKWRIWRTVQVERDLEFCHPRWPEEKNYIDSEIQQVRTYKRTYFRQGWNIIEWLSHFCIILLIITRLVSIFFESVYIQTKRSNKPAHDLHHGLFACVLLVVWIRLMRSCRAFESLGIFIAVLSYVVKDTLKFAFLFFEFFIPYAVGFWIMFGGDENAKKMGTDAANWSKFNDLLYSIWQMFVGDSFNLNGLVKVDRLMAQILAGSYLAVAGVVCLNLYIALLSKTFADAYGQAQATALMQKAQIIISVEKNFSGKQKERFDHYMQRECAPMVRKRFIEHYFMDDYAKDDEPGAV